MLDAAEKSSNRGSAAEDQDEDDSYKYPNLCGTCAAKQRDQGIESQREGDQ